METREWSSRGVVIKSYSETVPHIVREERDNVSFQKYRRTERNYVGSRTKTAENAVSPMRSKEELKCRDWMKTWPCIIIRDRDRVPSSDSQDNGTVRVRPWGFSFFGSKFQAREMLSELVVSVCKIGIARAEENMTPWERSLETSWTRARTRWMHG